MLNKTLIYFIVFFIVLRGIVAICNIENFDNSNSYFFIINNSGDNITLTDQNGMMAISGQLQTWSTGYDTNDFLIKNSGGSVVSWIKSETGDLYLSGSLYESTGSSPSSSGNFVIYNRFSNPVVWFTNTGDLYLKSCLSFIEECIEVPTWTSVGGPDLLGETNHLSVSGGELYAGSLRNISRYDGGTTWTDIGSGSPPNPINYMVDYDGDLFVFYGLSNYVQRYDPGTSTWTSTFPNKVGAGTSWGIDALDAWGSNLYAGRAYYGDVYVYYTYSDTSVWINLGVAGGANNPLTIVLYKSKLYVGKRDTDTIYRYDGNSVWTSVGGGTAGTSTSVLVVYNDKLYAGKTDTDTIYRYDGGTTWTSVGGGPDGEHTTALVVYNGKLYAGKYIQAWGTDTIYRYDGGTIWTSVGGGPDGSDTMTLAVYNGKLYAGKWQASTIYRYDGSILGGPNCITPCYSENNYETTCTDGVDNDCDGLTDMYDNNGGFVNDCQIILPGEDTYDACTDGMDNDRDGKTDLDDSNCATVCPTETGALCGDFVDNDCDGLIDSEDPGCVVPGCTDSCGSNYNPAALADDGSCVYTGDIPIQTITILQDKCWFDCYGTPNPCKKIQCDEVVAERYCTASGYTDYVDNSKVCDGGSHTMSWTRTPPGDPTNLRWDCSGEPGGQEWANQIDCCDACSVYPNTCRNSGDCTAAGWRWDGSKCVGCVVEMIAELYDGVGGFNRLDSARSVFVSGNYAYVAAGADDALTIIDISDPANPVNVKEIYDGAGGFNRLNGASDVFVSGNYAYVAASVDDAVTIIDISNPASPVWKSEIVDGAGGFNRLNGASDVSVSGNYAYVAAATDDALTIIDISDPANPVKKSEVYDGSGGFNRLNGASDVFVSGNYAYVTSFSDNALTIIDISDPANPVNVKEIYDGDGVFNRLAGANSVFVSGNYAYVTAYIDDALTIIDVSDPANPVKEKEIYDGAAGFDRLDSASDVFVFGNYAYVTANLDDALTIIDISDPSNPVKEREIYDGAPGFNALESASSVFVSGSYAYVSASSVIVTDALTIIDVSICS